MPGMHRNHMPEKPKNLTGALKKLLAYIRQYMGVIVFTILLAASGTILTVIGPDQLKKITNYIVAGMMGSIDLEGIASVGILLICMYAASAVCTFLQHFIMATVTQRISRRLRSDISEKINRLPLKYFSGHAFGDVLSRVTNDVDTIGQALNTSVAPLIAAMTQLVGCLVMMLKNNVLMALSAMAATALGFLLMSLIMSRSQKYFVIRQQALGQLNGYVEEMYTGHDVIRVSGAEAPVKTRFDGLNTAVRNANRKSQFLSGLMQPLMGFIGNLGYVVVCIVGALLVLKGKTDIGVIVAFMVYIRLFTSPLGQIAQAMTSVQQAAAASERVFQFLDEEELPAETVTAALPETVQGAVEFRHVRFSYPEKPDDVIIRDFSVQIQPGQKVAIVGPTGAGKTTLVNLLMRFYEPDSGEILIDGVPISALPRQSVHGLFGMVLQDTWLFEGTVRENLVYNVPDVSEERLIAACKACGIYHFIRTLPHGFETLLDDNTAISAGQKQLFTIARAMIQNSPMLILDEATSSVDTRTELLTQQAMDQLTNRRTSFVIAHRLSTIRNADLILVLQEGDIVEQGTHEALLEKGGIYAKLYNSQFDQAG